MLGFALAGLLDTSFLVPLQFYQSYLMAVGGTFLAGALAPEQLIWSDDHDAFMLASELAEGIANV